MRQNGGKISNGYKEETKNNLTSVSDDEIMGWKEEKRLEGWTEEDITRGLEEIGSTLDAEKTPSEIEGIKEFFSTPEGYTQRTPELKCPDQDFI